MLPGPASSLFTIPWCSTTAIKSLSGGQRRRWALALQVGGRAMPHAH